LSKCCHFYNKWFNITPTKIEKYALEKEIDLFLRSFLKKFPLFSKIHGVFQAKRPKKVYFHPQNWKIEKSSGILTFAKPSKSGDL
jgi:hypothetical protein